MRRIHQPASILNDWSVSFFLVSADDSAISQYYECIIRFLLLCVMNLASRHAAIFFICSFLWPNDDPEMGKKICNDLAKMQAKKSEQN